MPIVEVYESDEKRDDVKLLFEGDFTFLPRVGETISKLNKGMFSYYDVVEVWHRQEGEAGPFRACLQVRLDD